jgi:DNA primase
LALDADDAGQMAMQKMRNKIIQYGHPNVKMVKPPAQYKDWNNVLIAHNESILKNYVESTEKNFESEVSNVV